MLTRQARLIRVAVLIVVTTGVLFAQETTKPLEPPAPVAVQENEVASHRIGKLTPVVVNLVGGPPETRGMGFTIPVNVIVGPDGAVVSATVEGMDYNADDVPKKWIDEMKRAVARAIAQVRELHYRPFEHDGQPVAATFEEEVPVIPPELAPRPHVDFPEIRNWKSLRMTLERTGCFGTCPAYSVEVQGDGSVLYSGKYYVAVAGAHRGRISQQAVSDLLNAFRKADYFSLRDAYRQAITDSPTYTTSITFDGRNKKVVDYVGLGIGMPQAVADLEDAIDQLADTARWTKGNAATVRDLTEEKWNFKSAEAADTLARVVEYGTADAVCDLVAAGVSLNGGDRFTGKPFDRAASRGDLDMLRCILPAGPASDPVALASALSAAAFAGQLESVRLLLSYGANADAHPRNGDPPLVAAAASGMPAIVEEILKYRPDIGARGSQGRTALIAAATSWTRDENKQVNRVEVVRLLLAAGAEVNARDNEGNTALIANAWEPQIARLLLERGADINAANNKGWTALFSASSGKLARVLLEGGASLTMRNKEGKTPLHVARECNNKEVIAVLEAADAGRKP